MSAEKVCPNCGLELQNWVEVCPKCGTPLTSPTESKICCRSCGKKLSSETEICMSCGVRPPGGNKFCPRCGSAVLPEAEICVNCKTILKDERSKTAALSFLSDFRMFSFFLLGFASGLLLIIAGIKMLNINSVSGDTIMEASYHAIGLGLIGFGIFAEAVVIACGMYTGNKRR